MIGVTITKLLESHVQADYMFQGFTQGHRVIHLRKVIGRHFLDTVSFILTCG